MENAFANLTLEHCGLGIFMVDHNGLVICWNGWLAKHSRISADAAIGQPYERVFHTEMPKRLRDAIAAALQHGRSSILSHSINPTLLPLFNLGSAPAPEIIPHAIQIKALPTNDKQKLCVIEISDISAASQREQLLRNKSQDLKQLAALHRQQEAYARAVIENLHDALITVDEQARVLDLNHAAHQLFQLDDQTALHQDVRRWLPELNIDAQQGSCFELLAQKNDGSQFTAETGVSAFEAQGETQRVLIVRDLTERKNAEENLFRETELAQATLSSIHEAVITTDQHGRVNSANAAACTLLRKTQDQIIDRPVFDLLTLSAMDCRRNAREGLQRTLIEGTSYEFPESAPPEVRHNDGENILVAGRISPLKASSGKIVGALIAIRDVTLRHRMNELLTHQATHDELTELINRREFERQLGELLAQHTPAQQHVLLYIDLDQFKLINDSCGHDAGDQLLRQLTGLLSTRIRHSDTLGRLGGDEFAVLLRDCDESTGQRIAETLRETVSEFRFHWAERLFAVGASIGLIALDGHFGSLAEVLAAADSACYIAKENGRNQVVVYQRDGNLETQRKIEMSQASRIRDSLEHQRFALFCQPIVQVNGERWGIEILVRMLDEAGKTVPPMAFIPAAERYGLMSLIDRWVVEHLGKAWQANPERFAHLDKVAINLSGQSVASEDFLAFVENTLEHYRLPWDKICFEITETAAVASIEKAQTFMARLTGKGCRFALDDFGSGLSSFTYLKHLAVDYLKIDGAFVRDMLVDEIDAAMVRSISDIGNAMGLETIAEFVENPQVMKALKEAGVDWAQGYGICKPLPLAEIDQFRNQPPTSANAISA